LNRDLEAGNEPLKIFSRSDNRPIKLVFKQSRPAPYPN
jgi:hypothetical protein